MVLITIQQVLIMSHDIKYGFEYLINQQDLQDSLNMLH
jgi:hypothetical protein